MVCMCKRRVPDFPMTKCGDGTRGRGKGTRANEGKQRAKDAAWRSLTLRRFFQGRVRRAARSGTYSQVSAPRSGSKSVWESKTEA